MSKLFKTVMNHLAEITGYDKTDIKLHDSLVDNLGLDSMMIMDLHRLVLSDFPEVQEINLEKIFQKDDTTVEEVMTYIETKLDLENNQESDSLLNHFTEIIEFNDYFEQLDNVPYFRENSGIASNKILINEEEKINYSTYNYLGINGSNEINQKVIEAIYQYGTSVSSSRLLSGEIKTHKELEDKLSNFLGVEDALIQVGGHSTNVNTIGNIVGPEDLILHDALAHNSIIQGSVLSNAKRKPFKHNNMSHLESELLKLRPKFRRVLIVVEGVYSMDGDTCHLPELIRLKEKYNAILMVDEAHSIGTIGKNGRGITSYFNINPNSVDILMGTLSKSLNSCGGYIAGCKNFIRFLRYNSPGFIFSVGMTPANTAAAFASLEICEREDNLFIQLKENHTYFLNELKKLGVDTGNSYDTPIVPMIIGNSDETLMFSEILYKNGINAMPIVYPAVKESEARIRFFISAAHTKEDLNQTLSVIKERLVNKELMMTATSQ
ncbi:8-amino-7-oxononanoate synthase [Gracilibacillus halophilus YIM-C55.5]|uniref:8-amino-7-oxononanoate synthase n=1 Tax=Gracilibacillus halophilus YIM-C55.5 TaxID=1308866 RepID=N4WVY5_9BACI|nr:aminotransferase class I/II-fold pyridoxal phosphate-dependent enzyme [Gracilibacillus halophilus]ENH97256.1 8-amino-7-oxononanoate synthase [Gracilibacillus halophilus YIM-C55.5]